MYVCTCVFKYQCPKVKIQSSAAFQANEPAKDDVPEQLETKAVFGAQNMWGFWIRVEDDAQFHFKRCPILLKQKDFFL